MSGMIVRLVQILAYVGLLLSIVGGVLGGQNFSQLGAITGQTGALTNPAIAMAIGGIAGLLSGLLVFGTILVLIDIRKQTKRTADILDDLSRRRPPSAGGETAPSDQPAGDRGDADRPGRDPHAG